MSEPVQEMARFRSSMNRSCLSSFPGSHRSSASRKATKRLWETCSPVLRAADAPRFSGCLINETYGRKRRRLDSGSSVDPSSTTMTSRAGEACSSTLSIARGTTGAALNNGMTTLTSLCGSEFRSRAPASCSPSAGSDGRQTHPQILGERWRMAARVGAPVLTAP